MEVDESALVLVLGPVLGPVTGVTAWVHVLATTPYAQMVSPPLIANMVDSPLSALH